jgi:hypothetical protein
MTQITKHDLKAANQRFATRRAQYLYLTHLGYSQGQIAAAYGVSKRRVWQALHDTSIPMERAKLIRYRVPVPVRRG